MSTDSERTLITMSTREIMEVIPHRYPLLMVDQVLDLDLDNDRILAVKNCSMNEEYFQGHFPGAPIMPGVLILEALAQAGAIFVSKKLDNGKICVLLGIKEAKFRHPAKPGDQLMLECVSQHYSNTGGRVSGVASVNGKTCVKTEMAFAFVNKESI